MPDGYTHGKATIAASVCVAGVLAVTTRQPEAMILGAFGGLAGLFLSPDLDVDQGSLSDTLIRRFGYLGTRVLGKRFAYLFGGICALLWQVYWWPYGKFVAHRSLVSHSILLGTALRVVYIGVPIYLLLWYFSALPILPKIPYWWAFVGLCVSDALHVIMDKI